MTNDEMKTLKPGDIIKHKLHDTSVMVTDNYGERLTAVRVYDVSNPDEWDIIKKN